ncbi:MAG: universal stress protein, partial [Anaerolineales bacterium]|nr:universal stress protein [Anaerolineales bacterium]
MTTPRDDFVGELRLGKALTSIVQIVALALNIGLGLIVFYSSIILPEVNENPILLVLATAIALGLTLLNLVELIAGSGDWGGTYQIVYEILHRSLSFLTGWAILLASLALGAALALLAAELINGIFQIETPASWTAVGLLILLLVIQLFQFLPRRIQGWVFASLFSVIIVASLLTQSEEVGAAQLSAARTIAPQPATAFLTTAALICGAYAVFEAILSVRRQARNSSRLLPRSIFYTYLLWLGLAILAFMEFGRHTASIGHGEQFLIDLVRSYSFLPEFIGIALILLLLLIASHGLLMLAARQISGLVRTGGLPTWMREVRRPFPLPIFMFLAMGLILIPLTLLGEELSLAFLGSALFLFAMVILNIAAIRSHRSEPNRRRTINIPFPPLVPALAVGANLILLPYIPGTVLIVAAAWLAVGVALYFGYARSRLVEVKIVTSTFGRMAEMDENEYFYRILVPIGPGTERHFVLNTAITMARQVNGEVLPLQVVTLSDPLAIEEGRRTARERNTLFSWSIREAKNLGVPVFPITRLSRNVYDGILETAEEERINLILIPWAVKERFQSVRIGQSISQVVRRAPCDVAVLAYHPEAIGDEANASGEAAEDHDAQEADGAEKSGTNGFRRILIPTSGGPNAPLAVQIAVTLALETEARVTAVY